MKGFSSEMEQGVVPLPDMLAGDIWSMGCLLVRCLTGRDAFGFCGAHQCSSATLAREANKRQIEWVRRFLVACSLHTLMLSHELLRSSGGTGHGVTIAAATSPDSSCQAAFGAMSCHKLTSWHGWCSVSA